MVINAIKFSQQIVAGNHKAPRSHLFPSSNLSPLLPSIITNPSRGVEKKKLLKNDNNRSFSGILTEEFIHDPPQGNCGEDASGEARRRSCSAEESGDKQ